MSSQGRDLTKLITGYDIGLTPKQFCGGDWDKLVDEAVALKDAKNKRATAKSDHLRMSSDEKTDSLGEPTVKRQCLSDQPNLSTENTDANHQNEIANNKENHGSETVSDSPKCVPIEEEPEEKQNCENKKEEEVDRKECGDSDSSSSDDSEFENEFVHLQ